MIFAFGFVVFVSRLILMEISHAISAISVTKSFHGDLHCVHMKSTNME